MAHGWAGVLFGTFRWCEASTTPIPAAALERLGELSGRVRCEGERRSWVGPNDPALASSWCHGSAGLHPAVGRRRQTDQRPRACRQLCGCGRALLVGADAEREPLLRAAGQGYAMLVAHQLTGEDRGWAGTRTCGAQPRVARERLDAPERPLQGRSRHRVVDGRPRRPDRRGDAASSARRAGRTEQASSVHGRGAQ